MLVRPTWHETPQVSGSSWRCSSRSPRLWSRVDHPEELAHRDLVDVLGQAAEAASFVSTGAAETQRLARRARALLPPDSSTDRSAWLDLLVLRSRYTEAEQIPVEEVLAVVEQIPPDPPTRERVVACAFATHHLLQAGRTDAAETYVAEGVRSAYVLGLTRLEEDATSNEALLRLHQGRYADAMRSAVRARRIAEAGGDDLTRADSYGLLALIHWHVGDPVAASENCRRAVEILGGDRPGPFPFTWGMNATNLAETLVEQGEWTEAQLTLDHVLAVPVWPAWFSVLLGDAPADRVDLPAGQPVVLKPGAVHIMLLGLKQPLRAGESFPLTLEFEKAGKREVSVAVEKAGATAPAQPAAAEHADAGPELTEGRMARSAEKPAADKPRPARRALC